jgi:methyl-accepting chemotaxis protein
MEPPGIAGAGLRVFGPMKFIDDLKIGRKIAGAFLIIIVILLVVSINGFVNFQNLAAAQADLYDNHMQPAENLAASNAAIEKMRGDLYRYIAVPADRKAMETSINGLIASVDANMEEYGKSRLDADEKTSLARFNSAWQQMQTEYRQIMTDADAGNTKAVDAALASGSSAVKARQATLSEIEWEKSHLFEKAGTLNKETDAVVGSSILVIILASILAVIACIAVAWYLTRNIVGPVEKVKVGIKEFHLGRVSNRLNMNRKDELGEMADTLDAFSADFQKYILGTMVMVADGDLSRNLKPRDEKDEMIPPIKKVIETLRDVIGESNKLSRAAVEGKLAVRGEAEKFKGGYWEIIAGMNKTMDHVTGPLHEGMRVSGEYANGNFTARFDQKIEVHGDFKKFRQSLDNIGTQVSSSLGTVSREMSDLSAGTEEAAASVSEVTVGAGQIATNAQKVNENAEKSNASIEQVLKAMEDMSTAVQEVTTSMEKVSQHAKQANDEAKGGAVLAEKVEQDMGDIAASTETVFEIVKEIDKQMADITKIVELIRDLANQTNLLALNAAIEAARAGDAGRGFAVVASEVKSLAEESRVSAEKIEQMINDLNEATKNASAATTTSKTLVTQGAQMSAQTLQAFRKITEVSEMVANAASEVAAAAEEQAATTEQITASVHEVETQIANTTKEASNAAAATEEATASINEISKVVDNVNKIVEHISKEMAKFTV